MTHLANNSTARRSAHPATAQIVDLLERQGSNFRVVDHPPCRTSEESARARAAAGAESPCGAKAIVVKLTWRGRASSEFAVLVLPGTARIASKRLLAELPELQEFRFATWAELATQTDGLEPGMMPPFARPVFRGLTRLYIDASLLEHPVVGFNAADLCRSVVTATPDYVTAAAPTAILRFSEPKSPA